MMGWIWRMMTPPGLDTQVFKREQSGGQDAAASLKYQCILIPKGFAHTHMVRVPQDDSLITGSCKTGFMDSTESKDTTLPTTLSLL